MVVAGRRLVVVRPQSPGDRRPGRISRTGVPRHGIFPGDFPEKRKRAIGPFSRRPVAGRPGVPADFEKQGGRERDDPGSPSPPGLERNRGCLARKRFSFRPVSPATTDQRPRRTRLPPGVRNLRPPGFPRGPGRRDIASAKGRRRGFLRPPGIRQRRRFPADQLEADRQDRETHRQGIRRADRKPDHDHGRGRRGPGSRAAHFGGRLRWPNTSSTPGPTSGSGLPKRRSFSVTD